MADVVTMDADARREWDDWLAGRPPSVRDVAARWPPWRLYRLAGTGQRVTIHSYGERADRSGVVTLTVAVTGEYNRIDFGRMVFGIDPADLTECDLPQSGELVGETVAASDLPKHLGEVRLRVRPDLWERSADGEVVRRNATREPPP